jgi:FkbM family methyltransferase
MSIWQPIRFLIEHPLTQDRKGKAFLRFLQWQVGSRVLGEPVAMPFVNETRLLVKPGMAGATGNVYEGLHEYEDMAFVLHALRPSSQFVDVGANVGTYTVLAGGVGASCVSAEPVPATYEDLSTNVRLNNLCSRVDCRNVGVGEEEGELHFTESKGAENRVLPPHSSEEGVSVPVKTLDGLIVDTDASGQVLVVKIDVEGWETAVLRGGSRVLSRSGPTALILELNGSGARYGFDEEAVHERIVDKGYVPIEYDPAARKLDQRISRQEHGNTIYVSDVDLFSCRVEDSESYSVLGKEI